MIDDSYDDAVTPLHMRFGTPIDAQEPLSDTGVSYADVVAAQVRKPALRAIRETVFEQHLVDMHRDAHAILRDDLLAHIYCQSHQFFERLIVDVLFHMGYGGRRRDMRKCLGKSHDGGIDGVIMADELGLDAIYLQAKRLKLGAAVPVSHVRDFVGSLDAHHASKGVFVSTGHYTAAAKDFIRAVSRRVVLVDGAMLADIMIRHNIGVRVKQTFQFKELEMAYFKDVQGRSENPIALA
jgi:restriction system protein